MCLHAGVLFTWLFTWLYYVGDNEVSKVCCRAVHLCCAGDNEMTELKRRLMETEAQMSRILQAMEVVQQKVGAATDDTAQLMVTHSYVYLAGS